MTSEIRNYGVTTVHIQEQHGKFRASAWNERANKGVRFGRWFDDLGAAESDAMNRIEDIL